ncbi:unnamed protein product [Chrysodeixis includens]|uniref:Uncharacterized protein n=1 Tax=Chrysodeixis includens TaxID=689277 RepID=A0A9N8PX78_CHRIL|nr:unnamed protein product [Chrysodeixis includens]
MATLAPISVASICGHMCSLRLLEWLRSRLLTAPPTNACRMSHAQPTRTDYSSSESIDSICPRESYCEAADAITRAPRGDDATPAARHPSPARASAPSAGSAVALAASSASLPSYNYIHHTCSPLCGS